MIPLAGAARPARSGTLREALGWLRESRIQARLMARDVNAHKRES